MADAELSAVARALGRIPTGLYIVTTEAEGGPLGLVGSFVMQVGFDPPTVCVAIGRGRAQLGALRASGRFGLSILDAQSQRAMSAFFKKHAPGESPFDGLACERAPGGTTVLADALAWLECEVSGEFQAGDHAVVFGQVSAASVARAGDPAIHLRKNGLGY